MTITFQIEGIEQEDGDELACPDCKLSMRDNRVKPGASPMDCSCYGYGGPAVMPVPQFELNVSNVNGADLLRFLGVEFDYCGDIDPRDLLTALANSHGNHYQLEVDPTSEGNVYYMGRSTDQVARNMAKLEKIATKAVKYGRRVVWS